MISYAAAAGGSGPQHRVVLASQLREDNCHINRLNKLANDAHVRKFLGGCLSTKSTSKPSHQTHHQRSIAGSSQRPKSKKTATMGPISITSKKHQPFIQTSKTPTTCMTTKAQTRNNQINNNVSLNSSISMFSQGMLLKQNNNKTNVSRSRSPLASVTGCHKPTIRRTTDRKSVLSSSVAKFEKENNYSNF